jgi:hypothetical protein
VSTNRRAMSTDESVEKRQSGNPLSDAGQPSPKVLQGFATIRVKRPYLAVRKLIDNLWPVRQVAKRQRIRGRHRKPHL